MSADRLFPMEAMGDVNAGYIDYDSDDYRGCRAWSSDEERDEDDVDHVPQHMKDTNQSREDPRSERTSDYAEELLDDVEADLDARMAALRGTASYVVEKAAQDSDKQSSNATTKPGTSGMHSKPDEGLSLDEQPNGQERENEDDTKPSYYHDAYFDSDGEDNNTDNIPTPETQDTGDSADSRKSSKRKVINNEDLFYDPSIDDDNQVWMDNFRRKQFNPFETRDMDKAADTADRKKASAAASANNKERGLKAMPHSDAVLNCAACMSMLTLDCQRHDSYENQYRAMFVHNCRVITGETLFFREQAKKTYRNKKQREQDRQINADDQPYHPVKCSECEAVVAVYDTDEVYHFFNVLASAS